MGDDNIAVAVTAIRKNAVEGLLRFHSRFQLTWIPAEHKIRAIARADVFPSRKSGAHPSLHPGELHGYFSIFVPPGMVFNAPVTLVSCLP